MKKNYIKLAIAALSFVGCAAQAVTVASSTFTYNGHQYTQLSATDSRTDSETFAISLGGHLVAVNDAAEMNFLNATFGQNALWIGLEWAGSDWAWSNGDALTYTNWGGGEPNGFANEPYVHTYANSGVWNDLSNNSNYAGPKFGIVEVASVNVPEPGGLGLMFAGLGLMAYIARRRKAAK
jgi:hypothetical protein